MAHKIGQRCIIKPIYMYEKTSQLLNGKRCTVISALIPHGHYPILVHRIAVDGSDREDFCAQVEELIPIDPPTPNIEEILAMENLPDIKPTNSVTKCNELIKP